jgi:hypothetical protein
MNVVIPFYTQSPRPEVETVHVLDYVRRPIMYPYTSLPFFRLRNHNVVGVFCQEVILMVHKKLLLSFICCVLH